MDDDGFKSKRKCAVSHQYGIDVIDKLAEYVLPAIAGNHDLKDYFKDIEAINKVKHEQHMTGLIIDTFAFDQLVREIMYDYKTDLNIERDAVLALQYVVEEFIINHFNKRL